jgi:hypothetical protein
LSFKVLFEVCAEVRLPNSYALPRPLHAGHFGRQVAYLEVVPCLRQREHASLARHSAVAGGHVDRVEQLRGQRGLREGLRGGGVGDDGA